MAFSNFATNASKLSPAINRLINDGSTDVTLEITDPSNKKTILTTKDNTIKISEECEVYGVTNLPDYYTSYKVNKIGTYLMKLTANTRNGIRSIQDSFEVRNKVEFDR